MSAAKMECYAVVENCQEGIEAEAGFADILGLFLIDKKDKGKKALEKAEKCLKDRYAEAESAETYESGNEPDKDEQGMLCADWVDSGNDTAHFLDVRRIRIKV